MTVTGLAHISLYVRDLDASVKFYTRILGFETRYREDRKDMEYAEVAVGSCVIEILQWKDPDRLKDRKDAHATIDHFALAVPDIDAAVQELNEAGVPIAVGPFDIPDLLGGVRGLFIHGPDGESIELFHVIGDQRS